MFENIYNNFEPLYLICYNLIWFLVFTYRFRRSIYISNCITKFKSFTNVFEWTFLWPKISSGRPILQVYSFSKSCRWVCVCMTLRTVTIDKEGELVGYYHRSWRRERESRILKDMSVVEAFQSEGIFILTFKCGMQRLGTKRKELFSTRKGKKSMKTAPCVCMGKT